MLQIRPVVLSCCDFLTRELHPSNCLGIYKLAEAHDCRALADAALNFAFSHFTELIEHEEFLEADHEVVAALLESELLKIDSESQVLAGAMSWLKHDVERRRRLVFELLGKVRFPLIPTKLLEQFASEQSTEDASLRIAVRSMVSYHVSSSSGCRTQLYECSFLFLKLRTHSRKIEIFLCSREVNPNKKRPKKKRLLTIFDNDNNFLHLNLVVLL
jgi:hypothetical protein